MQPRYKFPKIELTDKQLIQSLQEELVRVKEQRNDYEQKLLLSNREVARLSKEVKAFEDYINRTTPNTKAV